MKPTLLFALLLLVAGCAEKAPPTQPPAPAGDPKPQPEEKAKPRLSEADAKTAAELEKLGARVFVDESSTDKLSVSAIFPMQTVDERAAALLNDLTPLRAIRGQNLKFKPGVLKLLKNHPALEELDFQGQTDYTTFVTLKELPDGPRITKLSLSDGPVTAEQFETIAVIPALKFLYIERWSNFAVPQSIRQLHKAKNLETLKILTVAGSLNVAELAGCTSLKELTCPTPSQSDSFFKPLAKFTNLRSLTLFGGDAPWDWPAGVHQFAALPELAELKLGFASGDEGLKALSGLKNLQALDISTLGRTNNSMEIVLTKEGIKALRSFPKLTSVRLAGSLVEGTVRKPSLDDAMMTELKGWPGLKKLTLSIGPISQVGAAAIGSLPDLESLTVHGLRPSADTTAVHIGKLTKLRELSLLDSDLTDAGLLELAGLKELETLRLVGETKTTSDGQATLQKALPRLKVTIESFPKARPKGK